MPASMRLRLRAACAAVTSAVLLGTAAVGADGVQDFLRRHWRLPLAPQSAAPRETLPHSGVTRPPAFLKAEFCGGCHQFAPDGFALNGKLLENTYNEWKASRFAREGVQCQDCHMPDRRHRWRGIHDADMVRSGLTITAKADATRYQPGEVAVVRLRVTSTRVGHAFPTYVTPRVILSGELVDG